MRAPPILSYEDLSLQQGAGWLFSDIDVFIGPRDRLALAADPTYVACRAAVLQFLYERHRHPTAA